MIGLSHPYSNTTKPSLWYEGAEIEDKYDVCKLTRSQYIEVSMLGNRGDILQAHKLIEDLDLHVHNLIGFQENSKT